MLYRDIIRAWRDEEYQLSLSEEQHAVLPEHLTGLIELADADLEVTQGGFLSLTPLPSARCFYSLPLSDLKCPLPPFIPPEVA